MKDGEKMVWIVWFYDKGSIFCVWFTKDYVGKRGV